MRRSARHQGTPRERTVGRGRRAPRVHGKPAPAPATSLDAAAPRGPGRSGGRESPPGSGQWAYGSRHQQGAQAREGCLAAPTDPVLGPAHTPIAGALDASKGKEAGGRGLAKQCRPGYARCTGARWCQHGQAGLRPGQGARSRALLCPAQQVGGCVARGSECSAGSSPRPRPRRIHNGSRPCAVDGRGRLTRGGVRWPWMGGTSARQATRCARTGALSARHGLRRFDDALALRTASAVGAAASQEPVAGTGVEGQAAPPLQPAVPGAENAGCTGGSTRCRRRCETLAGKRVGSDEQVCALEQRLWGPGGGVRPTNSARMSQAGQGAICGNAHGGARGSNSESDGA